MFELLQTAIPPDNIYRLHVNDPPRVPTPHVCHLILVAASPPDGTKVPTHNRLTSMDNVGWDRLPDELRKVCASLHDCELF